MNDLTFAKVPPHAEKVERALIGTLLDNQGVLEANAINIAPEWFYSSALRTIFDTMKKGKISNSIVLSNALPEHTIEIANCMEVASPVSGLSVFIDTLKDRYYRRLIMTSAASVFSKVDDYDSPIVNLLDEYSTVQREISDGQCVKNKPETVREILPRAIEHIGNACKHSMPGLPFGLTDYDAKIGNCQQCEPICIAGRPGMGKSALAQHIIAYNTIERKQIGIFFSLEMSKMMLTERLLFTRAKLSYDLGLRGQLPKRQFPALGYASGELAEAGIIIDDSPKMSAEHIEYVSQVVRDKYGRLDLIIVDYLGLMAWPKQAKDLKTAVGENALALKNVLKKLDCCGFILSQLSRAGGSGDRPTLTHLKESGTIEECMDKVVFIHRPEYYGEKVDKKGESLEGVAEIIVDKNKNGKSGVVKVGWDGSTMRFYNLSTQSDESTETSAWDTAERRAK